MAGGSPSVIVSLRLREDCAFDSELFVNDRNGKRCCRQGALGFGRGGDSLALFSVFRVGTGHVLCTNAARVGGASTLAQIRYPRTRSGPAPLSRRCRRGAGPPSTPPEEESGHRRSGYDDAVRKPFRIGAARTEGVRVDAEGHEPGHVIARGINCPNRDRMRPVGEADNE